MLFGDLVIWDLVIRDLVIWGLVIWGFGDLGVGDGIDCVWHDLLCCSLLLFMLIISKEFLEETGKKWKKTEVVEIILIVLG